MSGREILDRYIPLVEFLGKALGSNTEIVLHDLTVPDESILAIANGHISGRKIGGPVTNLALWFMHQGDDDSISEVSGYRAVNSQGRVCRSSSYFIRDDDGRRCGMLCINVDISDMLAVEDSVKRVLGGLAKDLQVAKSTALAPVPATPALLAPAPEPEPTPMENLKSNLENLVESMLDNALSTQCVSIDQMSSDDRIDVVRNLEDAGFFLLKGGIAAAADRLGVSEPTVYRYLVKVRH